MYRSLLRSSIPAVPRTSIWHRQSLADQSLLHRGWQTCGQAVPENVRICTAQQVRNLVDGVKARPMRKDDGDGTASEASNGRASADLGKDPYWRNIKAWENVSEAEFMSHRWQVSMQRKSTSGSQ